MNRNNFLTQIVRKQLGTINTAIEVGVWRGAFSAKIMSTLKPKSFYGVDPYKLYEGYTDKPGAEFNAQTSLDELFETTKQRLEKKGGTLIRNFSTQAAAEFDDDSIDFVYLDGDHQYQAIKQDIAAWYGKVRSGGILAGHDYVKGSLVEEFGVIPAVNEFVEQHQLELNTTNEKYATWWVTKP